MSDFFRLFIIFFQYSLILVFLCFTSITFFFAFNIKLTPKIIYSYWLKIIFFFKLKKISNISNYSSLTTLFYSFSLKIFLMSLTVVFLMSFTFCFFFWLSQSKKISYNFNYVAFYIFIFFKP